MSDTKNLSNNTKSDPKEVTKSKHKTDIILYFFISISLIALLIIYQFASYDMSINKENSLFYGIFQFMFGALFESSGRSTFIINWQPNQAFIGIPVDVLIGMLNVFTLVYGGAEGTSSLGRSISLPVGASAPMPEYKLKRFRYIILSWAILAMIVTIFQINIPQDQFKMGVDFHVKWIYYGLSSALIVYVYARQAPNIGHGITTTGLRVVEPSSIGGASAQTQADNFSNEPPTPSYTNANNGGGSGW